VIKKSVTSLTSQKAAKALLLFRNFPDKIKAVAD
jgi:hypothetical protein